MLNCWDAKAYLSPSKVWIPIRLERRLERSRSYCEVVWNAAPCSGEEFTYEIQDEHISLTDDRLCRTRYSKNWVAASELTSCIWFNKAMSSSGRSRLLPVSRGIRSYISVSKPSWAWIYKYLLTLSPFSVLCFNIHIPQACDNALSRLSVSSLIISESGSLMSSSVHLPSTILDFVFWLVVSVTLLAVECLLGPCFKKF